MDNFDDFLSHMDWLDKSIHVSDMSPRERRMLRAINTVRENLHGTPRESRVRKA